MKRLTALTILALLVSALAVYASPRIQNEGSFIVTPDEMPKAIELAPGLKMEDTYPGKAVASIVNSQPHPSVGPLAEGANAGPLGPMGSGDVATIWHDDLCFWLGLAIINGTTLVNNTVVDPQPDRANYANGQEDYIAFLWQPEQFLADTSPDVKWIMIDAVEIGMTEAFVYDVSTGTPYTFPEIMITPNIDNGSADPADWEPDIGGAYANTAFTPSFAVDPGTNYEGEWTEITGLAGTVVFNDQPFWIVVHLPPGEVSGLPFDCGTTRNCPDYVDPNGVLQHYTAFRWVNYKIKSDDTGDPNLDGIWRGPMFLGCPAPNDAVGVWLNG
ncbi:hypothetical protein ACFLU6_13620, partial [Acidobacteriota bacterium]